jgi:hypothetical protein
MSKPLSKVRLQSSTVLWANMVVAYKMVAGCLAMTLLIKNRRVRFQLAPDGVWRRRVRRKGANYWRKANAWDALQCRLAYGSYCKVYPRAPVVTMKGTD